MMVSVDDQTLWRAAARGDPEAFGTLFERHARRIYAYCFWRTGDWSLAEDLTSVTFLEAWRRRHVEVEAGKVEAWLYGIATNVIRTERRSFRRYSAALRRLPPAEPQHDFAGDAVDRADAERRMRGILTALSRLSAGEQEVIALAVWEGLSHADTAFALGMPVVTVRTRLFRALKHVREHLDEAHASLLDVTTNKMERNSAATEQL
jgi:RNA polymerase sigma factor (sigma-70 family)